MMCAWVWVWVWILEIDVQCSVQMQMSMQSSQNAMCKANSLDVGFLSLCMMRQGPLPYIAAAACL